MAKTQAKKSKTAATKTTQALPPPKARTGPLAGYLILARGKPLALSSGDASPKGGVLALSDQGTLFARLNAAQAALRRTSKHHEGKAKALNTDSCVIVRVDHPPAAE